MSVGRKDDMRMKPLREMMDGQWVLPVVQLKNWRLAPKLAEALMKGGIHCAEITFRAEGAERAIDAIVKAYPGFLVGAGTVLTCRQAGMAMQSGARFLVSPGLDREMAEYCTCHGYPHMPGVCTPTEVTNAVKMGYKALKFFPAEAAGGPSMLKALKGPFPDLTFMPTGGITAAGLARYLSLENVFACGGSWMVTSVLLEAENFGEITRLAAEAVKAADAIRKVSA